MSDTTGGEAGNDEDSASESSFGSWTPLFGCLRLAGIGLVFKLNTTRKTTWSNVPIRYCKSTTLLIAQVAWTSPAWMLFSLHFLCLGSTVWLLFSKSKLSDLSLAALFYQWGCNSLVVHAGSAAFIPSLTRIGLQCLVWLKVEDQSLVLSIKTYM